MVVNFKHGEKLVSFEVQASDAKTAHTVAERAYWDCFRDGFNRWTPQFQPTGCVYIEGRPVWWTRTK